MSAFVGMYEVDWVWSELRDRVDEERRRRGLACLERRAVGDRLEGRARLATAEAGDVELAVDARILPVVVVHRSHVGDDLAGRGVDRHQRAVADVLVREGGDPLCHFLVRLLLQAEVDRGRDLVAAGAQLEGRILEAEGGEDALSLAPDPEREVRLAQRARHAARVHRGPGHRVGLVALRLRDPAVAEHRVEDLGATPDRGRCGLLGARVAIRVLVRVVHARQLGQAGQERGLRQGELGEVADAEVVRGGGLDPVRAVAVVDEVEVRGEDPLLALHAGVLRGHLAGEDLLTDLVVDARVLARCRRRAHLLLRSRGGLGRRGGRVRRHAGVDRLARGGRAGLDALLRAEDRGVVDHLLGEGRGAAHDAAGLDVRIHRRQCGPVIHPVVRPEAAVLGRHGGVDQVLRDLVVGDGVAVLALESGQEGLAGAVVDVGGLRQRQVVEHVRLRQPGGEVVVRREQAARGAEDGAADHDHEGTHDDHEGGGEASSTARPPNRGAAHHQPMTPPLHDRTHRGLR